MTTHLVNTHDAKSRLSELIRCAEAGDEVILARGGKPVARLVRFDAPRIRTGGAWAGRVTYADGYEDIVSSDPDITEFFNHSLNPDSPNPDSPNPSDGR